MIKTFKKIFDNNETLAKQAYIEFLSNDENLAKEFFISYGVYSFKQQEEDMRKAAFDCIIKHYESAMFVAKGHCFRNEELDVIYEKHGKRFFEKIKRSLKDLYFFCHTFVKQIKDEEKDLLIKRIIGRERTDLAKNIVDNFYIWNLNKQQLSQLEALLISDKLKKSK